MENHKSVLSWFSIQSSCGMVLMICIFSSCTKPLKSLIQTSVDIAHERYVASAHPSPDKGDFGFNIMAMFILGNAAEEAYGYSAPENNFEVSALNNFNMNAVVSEQFDIRNENLAKYKSSPDFINNLVYAGGFGFVMKRSDDSGEKITRNYLQLPFYVLYEKPIEQGTLFGGLGPYFAYGLGGKTKEEDNGVITKSKSFDKENGFKRFDAGINLIAGLELKNKLAFSLGYDIGVVNLGREPEFEKVYNRGIRLNVMYPIDKIREKLRNNE